MANTRSVKVPVPHDKIQVFCEKWGITKLEVFGSAIRDDFDPESSDIDLLMTVGDEPPKKISLLDEVRMENEISRIFDRKVDLLWRTVVESDRNPLRKRSILERTEVIYGRP